MIALENNTLTLAEAVVNGLTKCPKQLPSWLFYDKKGDAIFQAIMRMPEYYPTRCEFEIFESHKEAIRRHLYADSAPFALIELGAGDARKTEVLLKHFVDTETDFQYYPTDISTNVLSTLTARLAQTLPALSVSSVPGRHEDVLLSIGNEIKQRKVFMFLGANIGNYTFAEAGKLVRQIASAMQDQDLFMLGLDLKKDPRIIQAAYDDPHGITREFNLNLLHRLNRELGAQFVVSQFEHMPVYDPQQGAAKSYLVSRVEQSVYIAACDITIHFKPWEAIHTEVSLKYDSSKIHELAEYAGLEIVTQFTDSNIYFTDVLLRKKAD